MIEKKMLRLNFDFGLNNTKILRLREFFPKQKQKKLDFFQFLRIFGVLHERHKGDVEFTVMHHAIEVSRAIDN